MSKPVQIVIVVVCLVAAAALLFSFANSEPANAGDEGAQHFHYICADQNCGNAWSWTKGEDLGGRDFPDTCTKCATPDGYGAALCAECGHYQMLKGHGTYEDPCPECGAAMPLLGDH